MKYNELFTIENGIFATVFKAMFADLYKTIFEAQDAKMLDTWCAIKYGNRTLIDYITADTYVSVVSSVITLNAERWTKVLEVLNAKYDVLKPVRRETEHSSNTEQRTSEDNENLNAKKAFNDGEFNDGERDTATRTGSTQRTESSTDTQSGIGYSLPLSSVIEKEKNLRNEEYRFSVIEDIVNEITLSIY